MLHLPFHLFLLILHIRNAGSYPQPLTAEQEEDYLRKMKNGDPQAREVLIERNMRLVAHIVKKYYASADEQDDLISIGTIGLIKGIDSFRCDKKIRLATYVSRCIENEILMHFRSLKKTANDVSIHEEIDTDKDGNALSLMDVVAEDDTILEDVYRNLRASRVLTAVEKVLEEREKIVIRLRYGLTEPPKTQKETAQRLRISRSYVSRIEKSALLKLKDALGDLRE
ncbi:MAG: RNA polymerase sporulation sigma factor SigK [Clostridia bacterium]|nr:RNA polymerase sporulation sigma factor SigK [Clostridia bacterium]MBQ5821338.1 RNA polymerase sporulation sigma factor SigK [Clostridia bacterium]